MASWYDALTSLLSPRDVSPAAGRPPARAGGQTAGHNATQAVADSLKLESTRRAHYGDYELMDAEAPEAHRALDVFSDTAAHAEGDSGTLTVEYKAAGVEEVFKSLQRETALLDRSWAHVRAFRRMGDHFAELVFDEAGVLRRVKDLPAREVRRVLDPYGLPDPYPWRQFDGYGGGKEVARFREWQIVHWGDVPAGEVYGHKRSQLAAARKPWRALEMAVNAALAERVLRTGSRLSFQVDVTGLSSDEAITYLREVKREYARTRAHDSSTGKRSAGSSPMTAMDDVWLPWTAGGPQKPVDVLRMGGEGFGSIDDIKFHYGRYLGSLEVPRYMLGIDEDLRSRSATSFIDASFVRAVVRCQQVYLRGFCAIADRALYAAGFDAALLGDRSSLYTASFSSLKLADEKLQWEIDLIRAQIAKLYSVDMAAVTQEFVLRYFLGLSEEAAAQAASPGEAYAAAQAKGSSGGGGLSAAAERDLLSRVEGTSPASRLSALLGPDRARAVTLEVLSVVESKLRPPSSADLPPTP